MPPGDDRYELSVFSAKGTAVYAIGTGQRLVVGRGDDADIPIDDDAISRRHAVFSGGPPLVVVRRKPALDVDARVSSASFALVRAPAMVRLYEEAARAAKSALPILVLGETGVGKDVLARFIHERSPRAEAPFVALNCAALSE